jgi:hypothetical protein
MDLAATGTDGPAVASGPLQTEWPAPPPEPQVAEGRVCAPTPTLSVHATFLVSLAVGGLLAALVRGSFGAGMGAAFTAQFHSLPAQVAALAGGGVLVGFGTALCGGCSSGHGLTGCGRLMPGSLVATATFFATAAAVSILLGRLA